MIKSIEELQKINSTSLSNIIFYTGKLQDLINELNFYNIIVAGNGIFVALKSDFGISINRIKDIKYSNSGLLNKLPESIIYSFIPKPPVSVFIEILEMFKHINNKTKWELCINVYYHKTNKTFHINIIDQTIGSATANYNYDEKFEMSENYVRYLQIHSHNTMAANFSKKDDTDENYTALCYYGVVGKINDYSKFYNVDMNYRIWNGVEFASIEFDDIFDLSVSNIELTNNTIERLNTIIEVSKKLETTQKFPNRLPPEIFKSNSPLFPEFDDDDDINKLIHNECFRNGVSPL